MTTAGLVIFSAICCFERGDQALRVGDVGGVDGFGVGEWYARSEFAKEFTMFRMKWFGGGSMSGYAIFSRSIATE